MSAVLRLPWQRPLPSNGALNILQFHCGPNLLLCTKFPPKWGCHGNGRCLVTTPWNSEVMGVWRPKAWTVFTEICYTTANSDNSDSHWSNIKIFKIQNGGRSLLENIRNAITCLQMDRLGRNLGGRISCSQYWKCYNSSHNGTDWEDAWVVRPSNTSAAKPFPWFWSLLLTAQRMLWFYGV